MIEVERTEDLARCLEIRRIVFMEEQGVSLAEEVDGLDPGCEQFLARLDGEPVGTARLRVVDGKAKGERLCVLARARGRGVAGRLLEALEARARELGAKVLVGAAQVQALPLYEARGYIAEGEPFLDANILHKTITKSLA